VTARLPAPGPIAGTTALPDAVSETEARLARLRDSASIADQPDRRWVDGWLHRSYLDFWASSR
jgi:hypothetical protein